jgi:hypothetical protein
MSWEILIVPWGYDGSWYFTAISQAKKMDTVAATGNLRLLKAKTAENYKYQD